jgi:hypothetical protein
MTFPLRDEFHNHAQVRAILSFNFRLLRISDILLTRIDDTLSSWLLGCFDEYNSFSARCSLDDDVHRRVAGLPGCDPLYAVAAGLIFGASAANCGKSFAVFICPTV